MGGQFLINIYGDNQFLSLSLFKQETALMTLIANPLLPQTREFKFDFDDEAFTPLTSGSSEADAPAVFTVDPFRMQRTSSNVSTDLGSINTLCVTII